MLQNIKNLLVSESYSTEARSGPAFYMVVFHSIFWKLLNETANGDIWELNIKMSDHFKFKTKKESL